MFIELDAPFMCAYRLNRNSKLNKHKVTINAQPGLQLFPVHFLYGQNILKYGTVINGSISRELADAELAYFPSLTTNKTV
jgi:hypothetical protein